MPLDCARSEAIAARIQAAPQECWHNAFRAMSCPDLAADVQYVEGWAVEEPWGLVFEHGWLEAGPTVIDPTPGASLARTYFAGLRLSLAQVIRRITTTEVRHPPFIRTWPRTSAEGQAYTQAYREAWVFAQLRRVLAPLDACSALEGDGLSRCLQCLLTHAGITHTRQVGTCTAGPDTLPLHWWIDLPIGWRIDYRAQRWLGTDPTVPHGVVRPADYPAVIYAGTPGRGTTDPDLFALLAPACDLAGLVAAVQAIPYLDTIQPLAEGPRGRKGSR